MNVPMLGIVVMRSPSGKIDVGVRAGCPLSADWKDEVVKMARVGQRDEGLTAFHSYTLKPDDFADPLVGSMILMMLALLADREADGSNPMDEILAPLFSGGKLEPAD